MGYGAKWLLRAVKETRQYWTAPQIVTTVVAPVAGGIAWAIFKPWEGWRPIMQIAAVSFLGFLALWGLVFLFSCFVVPGKMYAELETEVSGFRARAQAVSVSPLERARRERVAEKLKDFSAEETPVLRFVLEHGRVSQGQLHSRFKSAESATSKGTSYQILHVKTIANLQYFIVNPEFQSALSFHFYGE